MPRTITKTIDAEGRIAEVDVISEMVLLTYEEIVRENGAVISRTPVARENITDFLNPGQRQSLLVLVRNAINAFRASKYA